MNSEFILSNVCTNVSRALTVYSFPTILYPILILISATVYALNHVYAATQPFFLLFMP